MNLPRKFFFSVSELAERWGAPEAFVREHMLTGSLMPSVFVDDALGWRTPKAEEKMPNAPIRITGEIQFLAPHALLTRATFPLKQGIYFGSHQFFLDDDNCDELDFWDGVFFEEALVFNVSEIRVRANYIRTYENIVLGKNETGSFSELRPAGSPRSNPADFYKIVTGVFEEQQPANLNDDSELKRTQRAMAALVLGLADKHPAYKSGDKPNASQLARTATEHLRDEHHDRTPPGFSETTVRQVIAAALKACPDLKK